MLINSPILNLIGKVDTVPSLIENDLFHALNYIANQEKHHRKKTFLTEYLELLQGFEVEYNEQYIFKPLE